MFSLRKLFNSRAKRWGFSVIGMIDWSKGGGRCNVVKDTLCDIKDGCERWLVMYVEMPGKFGSAEKGRLMLFISAKVDVSFAGGVAFFGRVVVAGGFIRVAALITAISTVGGFFRWRNRGLNRDSFLFGEELTEIFKAGAVGFFFGGVRAKF